MGQGNGLKRHHIPAMVNTLHRRRTRRRRHRYGADVHRHVASVADVIDCWVRWNA